MCFVSAGSILHLLLVFLICSVSLSIPTFLYFIAVCKTISCFPFCYCPSLSLWIRSVHILNYHYHLFISNWSGMHLSSSCYQLSASGFNLNVFIILSHRLVFGWEAWSVFPMPSLHCSAPEFGFCSLLFPCLLGPECRTVEQDLLPVTLVQ